MNYLLDTNVISELVRAKPSLKVLNWVDKIPDEALNISVITLGEIRKGIEKVADSRKKEKLRIWLEHELPYWFAGRILEIDVNVADTWGRLQGISRHPLPAIDSLIAATAINFNLSLVTRNVDDFKFTSLEVINPWEI